MKKLIRKMLYLFALIIVLITGTAFYIANPIMGKLPDSPAKPIQVDSTELKKDVVYLADSCYPRILITSRC